MDRILSPGDREAFDAYAGRPRVRCTGGVRYFNLMPHGGIDRCAELRSAARLGNIMDPAVREQIAAHCCSPTPGYPCEKPVCTWQCSGCYVEQQMEDGALYTGPYLKSYVGFNYCMLGWELEERCTGSCVYCCSRIWMQSHAAARDGRLSASEAQDVCEWFCRQFDGGYCMLLGGEPTLHPALSICASTFCACGWRVDIATNMDRPVVTAGVAQSVDPASRHRLGFVISAHVHRPDFDIRRFLMGIELLRASMGAQGWLYVVYVDHPANHERLPFDNLRKRALAAGASKVELVRDYGV